jgi:hypothetical protein
VNPKREQPLWSMRRKAEKIVSCLRNQYNVSTVWQLLGLKNRAYVSWLEGNRTYTSAEKYPPKAAYDATLAYYEAHKNDPPFNGMAI